MSIVTPVSEQLPATRRTPAALRRALAASEYTVIHQHWCAELKKARKRWLRKTRGGGLLALWSVDDLELSGRERELAIGIEDVGSDGFDSLLQAWLDETDGAPGVWESLAIAEILLTEMPDLSPEVCVRCLGILATAFPELRSAEDDRISPADSKGFAASHSLESSCRLDAAWQIALLLTPLQTHAADLRILSDEWNRALQECTCPDGYPHGSLLLHLREFLTPLVRSAAWSDAFQETLWDDQSVVRFRRMVEICCLHLLPDGTLLASAQTANGTSMTEDRPLPVQLLSLAARLAGFKPTGRVRQFVEQCGSRQIVRMRRRRLKELSRGVRPAKASGRKAAAVVSWQSDVSCTALMRSAADPLADVLQMEWHSDACRLSLAPLGLPLLDGVWTWRLRSGDSEIETSATWNCTCWFLDGEVVFAELEAQEIAGARLIRHALLSTMDHFAILTDTVTCDAADRPVTLSASLPLTPRVAVEPDAVTREVQLILPETSVRAFPVWLPDDRIVYSPDSFGEKDGQLVSTSSGLGGTMSAVVLDWHPARGRLPADWTRLTVAEAGRPVSSREAAAARLRIGTHQLLIYRSLIRAQVNRTVLGLHTADESVYGRIPKNGQTESLVQVEQPPPEE